MDPISFITEITSTVVANLWEDPKESPSAFLRQQTQEQMQKHFMLIPELLGTTAYLNNVDVHNPNGGDFEDEDWKLYRQLTQSQSDAMRRRKADKRRHEGTGDGLSSFPADIDFDVHVDYPMKRAKPTFQDGMFCNNVGDVDLLNMLDEPEFEKHLHMNKMSFLKIFQFLRSLLAEQQQLFPADTTTQTVFSLALWKLTTGESYPVMARRFQKTQRSCRLLVKHFWNILGQNYHRYVEWPNSVVAHRLQLQGFQQQQNRFRSFAGLFGIILVQRFTVQSPNITTIVQTDVVGNAEGGDRGEQTSTMNIFEVILQLICNADQKVIDCHVALATEYHFDRSPIAKQLNGGGLLNNGSYLIGNRCFPLRSYLVTPFSRPENPSEVNFNRHLAVALEFGQNTMNSMMKRFHILHSDRLNDLTDLNTIRRLMESICVLHNLSIAIEDDYLERSDRVTPWKPMVVEALEYSPLQEAEPAVSKEEKAAALQRRQQLMRNLPNVFSAPK